MSTNVVNESVPATANVANAGNDGETPMKFSSASLYVGDLHPDATEQDLMDAFGSVGPIVSIRLLRDLVTRRSLRYAYVNFAHPSDAERALDTLNFSEIKGKPIRVMWLQRDPSVRKSGLGNIFVKNLPKDCDNKDLFDIFSAYGNILSCKVATASDGSTKGYGYVHFETQQSADTAIKEVNGSFYGGSTLVVSSFVPRKERSSTVGDVKFNNVYVKNLPDSVSEKDLQDMFTPFGEVLSVFLKKDDQGNSKGFGFVSFGSHDAAKNAVDALNGKEIDGKAIYAGRAQKKAERTQELRRLFEQMKLERASKYQGVNLYVKNLDDSVDDEGLRKMFEEFGNITSAKVMRDEKNGNVSKGFGFVCFTTPEEATRAVTTRNSQMMNGKPLYVAIAQKKEYRQAQLAAQYAHRGMPPMGMAMPNMAPMPNMPPNMPMYRLPVNVPMGPMGMFYPRGPVRPGAFPPGAMPYNAPPMARGGRRGAPRGGMGAPRYNNARGGAANPGYRGGRFPAGPAQAVPQVVPQGAAPMPAAQPIDPAALSQLDVAQQKQILGTYLYPLISQIHPQDAAKLTGMILEMDCSDIINLLETPHELQETVEEAAKVLASQQQPSA